MELWEEIFSQTLLLADWLIPTSHDTLPSSFYDERCYGICLYTTDLIIVPIVLLSMQEVSGVIALATWL